MTIQTPEQTAQLIQIAIADDDHRFIWRRNKMLDGAQYEVIETWSDVISDETQRVLAICATAEVAEAEVGLFRCAHEQKIIAAAIAADRRALLAESAKGTDEAYDDPIAWAIVEALHANVPEDKRPQGWCDLNSEQEARIRAAKRNVLAALLSRHLGVEP